MAEIGPAWGLLLVLVPGLCCVQTEPVQTVSHLYHLSSQAHIGLIGSLCRISHYRHCTRGSQSGAHIADCFVT